MSTHGGYTTAGVFPTENATDPLLHVLVQADTRACSVFYAMDVYQGLRLAPSPTRCLSSVRLIDNVRRLDTWSFERPSLLS